jgi:hypothetical protein
VWNIDIIECKCQRHVFANTFSNIYIFKYYWWFILRQKINISPSKTSEVTALLQGRLIVCQ